MVSHDFFLAFVHLVHRHFTFCNGRGRSLDTMKTRRSRTRIQRRELVTPFIQAADGFIIIETVLRDGVRRGFVEIASPDIAAKYGDK